VIILRGNNLRKKSNQNLILLISFLFISFLFISTLKSNASTNDYYMKDNNLDFTTRIEMLDNYTVHAPIFVDSNDDFVTLGCEGNGTISNPYIIDGLNITQTGMNAAIKIQYTSAHFIINCCLILSEYVGIHLDHVGYGTGTVKENICISSTGDGGGIGLSSSSGCNIISNECSNFMQGIHFNHGSSNIVYGNFIYVNNYQGINIRYSDSNIIRFNTIQDSEQHGLVYVGTASNNHASHNIFINNSKVDTYNIDGERTGTITSQGYDEGSNNIWYNETEQEGNRWSDYNGRGVYAIDGPSNSEDIYPLTVTETQSVPTSIIMLVISFLLISSFYQLVKKGK
jgi:parallel beta-helix repeat protein